MRSRTIKTFTLSESLIRNRHFFLAPRERLMQKPQQEIRCSICDKRVTLQEGRCLDENGKAVHTNCYGKRILQGDGQLSDHAA
jgi:hypothetical protein